MKKLTGPILIVGSSGEAADVRYATGFAPLDPILFLQDRRKKFLVVPELEVGRAGDGQRGVRVLTPGDLRLSARERRRLSGWALGLLRHGGWKRVNVGASFPVGLADRLRRSGITVQVVRQPLFPGRAIKTDDEVACVAESQKAAVAGVRAAMKLLRAASVGPTGVLMSGRQRLTSERVRYAIETTMMQRGAKAMETIVAGGKQGAEPHERGDGPLRAGEPIVLDVFPQHTVHGYWGDITRTVSKGQPAPKVRRMYRAVKEAQEAALRAVRPGVKGATIHRLVQKTFDDAGFKTRYRNGRAEGFFHGTGHGVGLDIHEAPSVSPAGGPLRSGHVVTIEPGLYYPDCGGVRIEDTVVVTPKGFRYLATCSKALVL